MSSYNTAGSVAWIVDDSPLEAEMARAALSGILRCEIFADGEAMLETIATSTAPDVVILDWRMPGISGIEVTEFLRSSPATSRVPIVMLTGLRQAEDVVRGLAAGCNGYVTKPFAPAELAARVEAVMRAEAFRARAERAEAQLHALLAQLPEAVVAADARGVIRFANDRAVEMFQARCLPGRTVGEMGLGLDPALLSREVDRAGGQQIEHGGRVLGVAVRRMDSPEVGEGYLITLRDVTERSLLERRRLDFYSIIAHDLRNPLNAISLRTQLVANGGRGSVAAGVKSELERVIDRIAGLNALIDDFLDLARLDAAGLAQEHSTFDLGGLVEEVVAEARLVGARSERRFDVELRMRAEITGVRRRISQVVSNLVTNAMKFSGPEEPIRIVLAEDGDAVRVEVVDRGVGLDEATLNRLFQRYTRAANASEVKGTGLGLLIVREIVEAHGGTVGVRSRVGEGSTFWFRLPIAKVVP